jgi:hypothetical protein
MDAGHAEHLPAPHAPDPDLTISSPAPIATTPAKQGRLNTSLAEEREVATRVMSCPTVNTMSSVQEMLNKFLK